jgi:hypothetical protein
LQFPFFYGNISVLNQKEQQNGREKREKIASGSAYGEKVPHAEQIRHGTVRRYRLDRAFAEIQSAYNERR